MNTTKGSPLGTNKETAKNLPDVRIILAVLWVARMLSSLNGDTYRLSDPVALKALLANTGPVVASRELLLVMSIIFVVPIFMSFLTLTLKYPAIRWANIIVAVLVVVFNLFGLPYKGAYDNFLIIVSFVFNALTVWYAWKWIA